MTDPQPNSVEADLCGLPVRGESISRDPLEEIASSYLERLRTHGSADIEFFVATNPHLEQEIREFLPLVAAMENWKATKELQVVKHPLPDEFEIDQLGDCKIVREIARGGMGVVFEAEQAPIMRRVAVKLLPWKFSKTSKWAQQFQREARIAARLQHKHIVPIFSFGEHEGRFYYVMQLIEGISLEHLINRWQQAESVPIDGLVKEHFPHLQESDRSYPNRILQRDAWQQIAKIAAQVAGALSYAHRQHTMHRDIKPGNLLIDLHGKLWITDFGLAVGRDHLLQGERNSLAGTLRYMAPEQFRGEGDDRSDLYSFGATLYELCTRRPIYQATTKADLMKEIQNAKIVRPRRINRSIPNGLSNVIMTALHQDPEQRYKSAAQLQAELLAFLGQKSSKRRWWGWR